MTDSLYNTLAEINGFSDGECRFVRQNPLLQHICALLPTPANRISLALMDKCLSNPTGRGKEPSWESVSDMSVDKFNTGRWSPPLSVLDIAGWSFSMDEMYDSNGIVLDWMDSRVSLVVKSLEKGKMFFPFKIKVGRVVVWIETYNRYFITIGYLWKQTVNGRKKGHKDFVSKDYVHQLPIVPQHIVSLTTPHSLFNAVYRMRNKLHGQLKHCAGWNTMDEVEENIKVAYCSSFLQSLIDQTDPSVKKLFLPYESSGLEPVEYIKMIHNTAKVLPPFQGIEITPEVIFGLRVPARTILDSKEIFRSHNSANLKKIASEGGLGTPLENKVEGGLGTPLTGVEGGLGTPLTRVKGGLGTPSKRLKIVLNSLKINEIGRTEEIPHRTPLNYNTYKEEQIGEIVMNETSEIETVVESISAHETDYNESMSDSLTDKSMTEEQLSAAAFSNPSFVPVNGTDVKRIMLKYHPKEIKVETEEDRRKKVEHKLMAKSKVKTESSKKTILNDAQMFMSAYKRIFQEHNPTAKISPMKEYQIQNLSCIKSILDKLHQCGTLDIDVLHSWMHHTAEFFKKRTGYITVSLMLKTWDSFSRQMISSEVVANKKQAKAAIKEAIKRDTIGESMNSYFASGITPAAAFKSCCYWGVVLTAAYLSSHSNSDEAIGTIEAALTGQHHRDLSGIFTSTIKFEIGTPGMILSDWRVRLASFVAKAGKIEIVRQQGSEKEWCDKFITGLSRRS